MIKVNDLVVVKIDPKKTVYKVINIDNENAMLKGYICRIKIMEKVSNLLLATKEDIYRSEQIINRSYNLVLKERKIRSKQKVIFGTVLHIDGDEEFLNSCLNLYQEMKVHAWGIHLKEKEVKNHISKLLDNVCPNIVVITGHDFYNGKGEKDLNNYENSKEFIEVLRIIRSKFNTDSLTVIIGACASHFEALIANGANFASSPARINIHTYDPAVIAIKCATTSCNKIIDFENVLKYIENGRKAYGALETKGNMKILL